MGRALALAMLVFVAPAAISGQTLVVLHIRAVLTDPTGQATPVGRHALLISDNPPTREPRRVVTSVDGTADVRLRPGNYTVESDQPVAFQGQGVSLDADPGRRRRPRLGPRTDGRERGDRADRAGTGGCRRAARNRHVAPAAAVARQRRRAVDSDRARVGIPGRRGRTDRHEPEGRWRRDVGGSAALALGQSGGDRPRSRSSARHRHDPHRSGGHGVDQAGAAWMLEQPTADRARAGDLHDCRAAPAAEGLELGNGEPRRHARHRVRLDSRHGRRGRAGVHRLGRPRRNHVTSRTSARIPGAARRASSASTTCATSWRGGEEVEGRSPPPARRTFPWSRRACARRHVQRGRQASRRQPEARIRWPRPTSTSRSSRRSSTTARSRSRITDFSNWSEYVADIPPVLFVRVTPKMVESLWAKVARGAAMTQGMALAGDQAAEVRLPADAGPLRRHRGDADPPVQARAARLRDRGDLRRSVRVRSGGARTRMRHGDAGAVFGEGAGEGRHAGRRSRHSSAGLARLRSRSHWPLSVIAPARQTRRGRAPCSAPESPG